MKTRVRYAPSPTGLQHIGGVRTALFNYFFAKASGGEFFLRIEDTDQSRYDDRAVEDIYETLAWLGIELDEGPREGGEFGPYVQSQRVELYKTHSQKLVNDDKAYACFCSSEDLERMREQQTADGGASTGYDRRCRDLDPNVAAGRIASGEKHVIRFKGALLGETMVNDILLGEVAWPNKNINPDPVILKSDGFPTYHLAHVVDDHFMQTSHVLRGQEWLPSAPLHVQIFEAFAWQAPIYCHLSMIMGSDGHKLSKRHGSTSAQDFRLAGYLPEAIINYITLLGWSFDGERELFEKQDLEKLFTLEKLSKSPASFDYQKLDWFNAHYLRSLDHERLCHLIVPEMQKAGLFAGNLTEHAILLSQALPIARDRLHKLSDAPIVLGFLFAEPDLSKPELIVPKKQNTADVCAILEKAQTAFVGFLDRSDEQNEAHFHQLAQDWGLKLGQLLMPLRLVLTGTSASPPLMPSIRLLGLEKTTRRLAKAIQTLKDLVK